MLKVWPFTIPVPVEIEVHTVPHFKASVNAKVELWRLACGGTFTIQTSLLKIGYLLHKWGFVATEVVGTVTRIFYLLSWSLNNFQLIKLFRKLVSRRLSYFWPSNLTLCVSIRGLHKNEIFDESKKGLMKMWKLGNTSSHKKFWVN